MANPNAPAEGTGKKMLYLSDTANVGTPYLPLGDGAIALGGGNTAGAVPGAAINGRVSGGLRAWGYFPDTFKPFSLTAVTTEQKIWDVTGTKFRLLGCVLTADATTNIAFLDGTGGSVIYRVRLLVNVATTLDLGPIGILSGATSRDLYITSSALAAIVGTVWGTET